MKDSRVTPPTAALRLTTELPTRVPFCIAHNDAATSFAIHGKVPGYQPISKPRHGHLQWSQPPRTILIKKKPRDAATDAVLVDMVRWLRETYPTLNVVLEHDVAQDFVGALPFVYVIPKGVVSEYSRVVDFAITLGGDGTVLHLSALFPGPVPPVISFSMGTLGFLLPFDISNYRPALERVIEGRDVTLLPRMRLSCSVHEADGTRLLIPTSNTAAAGTAVDHHVMNEVLVHRGRFPHLTSIDCWVDGEFLTNAVADGLIVGSPTGSTAYSLSAGGPIVHPALDSLLLTPICPRSLSFRTTLLPAYSVIQLHIAAASRSIAEVSLDGREVMSLRVGQYLQVRASPYPVPCVNRVGNSVDWARDINGLLKFNQNFTNKQQLVRDAEGGSDGYLT
ncbi:NADH kinase pos5 [Tieghemiomyces parasiticus]|uniref:NADH kinase pos5 n=1 Tax=Tieghemiomyces parasiticus TaxID=78921 RepID=A0A9W8E210_9FUNG|nr:NADH kinase pos5 [Tieghemiomyces parasiticus]